MNEKSLPTTESLHGHIRQNGVLPGPDKLAAFQNALKLRDTPALYSQENAPVKIACVKFFDPCGSWTWYATEWDGKELCFGYVKGHESEWGYFDLRELAEVKGRMGIGIEVDEHFLPQPIRERSRSQSQGQEAEMEMGD
ncbi:MAG: DUF2958 domain-containing protein [Verrucomicrobiae bacterium]|nr:DUF2958 domain-containing protein [Verrucomicrobiae bacterium]